MNRTGRVSTLFLLSGAIFLAILLSSCSSPEQNTAILWTNQPEFAAYVESFNAHQSRYRVMLVYKANPAAALSTSNMQPDVVVGEYLRSQRVRRYFSSLNGLMAPDRIDPAQFYPGALKATAWGGDQLFLPVSFDLPAIVFLKGAIPADKDTFFVSLAELGELAKGYNELADGAFTRVGFSPDWSGDFLYTYASLSGANFRENGSGNPTWDEPVLQTVLSTVHHWIGTTNSSMALDTAFRERYVYEPPYVLITGGRIEFAYMNAASYFQMAESKRQKLGFRWIAQNERVPVLDNLLLAGIPNHAQHRGAAKAFLLWFFQEKTLAKLLDESQIKQLTSFGISNGFSTFPAINDREFPKHYPSLLGHIPKNFDLLFPPALPKNWQLMQEEVVRPWLQQAASTDQPTPALAEQIKQWLLQQGD